jgi:hypothetical protein
MNMRILSFPHRLPRRALYYGLFGILGALLILLAVNDKNWRPLKGKTTWDIHSNYSGFSAYLAVDLNLDTAWSSHVPMEFGMYYQVNVGKPVTMNGLLLRVGEDRQGQPIQWALKTSFDGESWHTQRTGKGIPYKSMLVIPFEATRAQYVQLTQTSISSSPFPWMITELDVLQPVLPWQFQRGTLILVILGWLFFMLGVLVLLYRQTAVFSPVALTLILLVILLSGWLLRVYDLDSYEFSDHEYQLLSVLTFDDYTHDEWFKLYLDYSKTGAHWLTLLCVRWAYQFSQSQFVALGLVPAVFGVISVLLLYISWGMFSQNGAAEWEALSAASLIGWSGWDIFLSRSGFFSAPLLCVVLLYLLIAYHFLYRRGSYFLTPILAIVLCAGLFLHPLIGLVPIGLVMFGVFHMVLCRRFPGFLQGWHILSFSWQHNIRRLLVFLLSVLPGYAYWLMFAKMEGISKPTWQSLLLYREEFLRALRFSGITGLASWLFWGLVVGGTLYLLFRRDHGEWFFFSLAGFVSISSAVLSPEGRHASVSLLMLVLSVLAMKGLHGSISFCCPRLAEGRLHMTRMACMAGVGFYALLFSINSFAFVSPLFPYASELREDYRSRKAISELVRIIHEDTDPCKTVLIRNQDLAARYGKNYDLQAQTTPFSELQRLAEQGIFGSYLLMETDVVAAIYEYIQFFDEYYTDVAGSSRVTLYRLKEKFHNTSRRYYVQDLFFSTGHHLEDEHASRGVVRFTTPDDAPGLLSFGPFARVCKAGRYIARIALRVIGGADDEPVARVDIIPDNFGALASLELTGADFPDPDRYETFELPFDVDFSDNPAYPMKRVQFFVHVTGNAEVRLDYIDLVPGYEE